MVAVGFSPPAPLTATWKQTPCRKNLVDSPLYYCYNVGQIANAAQTGWALCLHRLKPSVAFVTIAQYTSLRRSSAESVSRLLSAAGASMTIHTLNR